MHDGIHGLIRALPHSLAAFLCAIALTGCAGEGTSLITGGPSTGESSGLTTSATPDKSAFNPFAQGHETDSSAREVILNPSRDEVMKPGALPEFSIGKATAPVTIVKYMSLTCQYCRRFQAETYPALKRDYIDKGHVRLILREFPIGKTSGSATIALRCAPIDKYLPLYEKFLAQQATWVSQEVRPDAIYAIAKQVGMKRETFDACLKDQALIANLTAIKDRGRQLGIIGTPNFFVENKLVKKVVGMAELKAMIDPLLAGQGAGPAAPAGTSKSAAN